MGASSSQLDGDYVDGKNKPEVGLMVEVRTTKVYHVWAVLCLYVVCKPPTDGLLQVILSHWSLTS